MKRLSSILLGAVAMAALGLGGGGACGGGVSVQGQGGAGSESTTNGTGSQSTGSQSTGSSVVTTGTGSSGVCADSCAKAMQLACIEIAPDCEAQCQEDIASAGECGDELTAALACITATAVECGGDLTECQDEFLLVNECFIGACEPAECAGGGGGGGGGVSQCVCSQSCEAATFESHCQLYGGNIACTCYVDGDYVGFCDDDDGCDIEQSCCWTFFTQSLA